MQVPFLDQAANVNAVALMKFRFFFVTSLMRMSASNKKWALAILRRIINLYCLLKQKPNFLWKLYQKHTRVFLETQIATVWNFIRISKDQKKNTASDFPEPSVARPLNNKKFTNKPQNFRIYKYF